SRPLLVDLNSQLGLATGMGTTYILPFDHEQYDLHPQDLFISQDMGTIICGNASGQGDPFGLPVGAFLLKTGPAGDVQWFNVYTDIIEFKSVIEMPDMTLVACGWRIEPPNAGPEVAVMVQTTATGTPMLAVDVWSNKGGAVPGDARF